MSVGILLLLPGTLESDLVQALNAPGTGTQVVRRCADLPEVLAAAGAGVGAVAVVTAEAPGTDRTALARLRQAEVRTMLVAEEGEVPRCRMLGADVVVPATAPTAELARLIIELAHRPDDPAGVQRDHTGPSAATTWAPDGGQRGPDVVAEAEAVLAGATSASTAAPQGPVPGLLVAVWGPFGAPGRTTVAANLAAELAGHHGPVLLVDADTQAPSLAQVLGVLEDSSGVAAAARLAAQGRLDGSALHRLCRVVDPGLWLLSGLTRADRWRELPAAALQVLWERARELAPWTVVDLAAGADAEGAGAEHGFGPRRHEATVATLAAADVLLVVGGADPVGMRRLVVALADLQDRDLAAPHAQQVVVVNRVRASATGHAPRRAVQEALARFAGVGGAVLVPEDRAATDRAVLTGVPLAQAAPTSPAREAIADLAMRLTGAPTRRRRRAGLARRRG